ncbi:hypothetical protein DB41_AA00010 [Neochlamydia sp. TUME1]|nr:hypothetical protein DB41_AA00010 [Neochlamydia sp. TUME1]
MANRTTFLNSALATNSIKIILLFKLSKLIGWKQLEEEFDKLFVEK